MFKAIRLKKMKTLVNKYSYNISDTEEIRLAKSMILIIANSCCFCGLIWSGIYYYLFGLGFTSILPLVFVGVVISSIFISHFASNYKILVHVQLVCITFFPALIQWRLGSINDSGFVIAWCFLGPFGALLFLDNKHAKNWMLIFILIVGISIFFVPTFSNDAAKISENTRNFFYLVNVGTPFMLIFIATSYFLKNIMLQRQKNLTLLKITNEKNQEIKESLDREKELGLLKSNFVSTASHQFRTPMAAIQSNTELLEMFIENKDKGELKKYKKVIGRITGGITKMTDLMDDVLILGKLTSGNISFVPQEIDLVEFCKKLVNKFNLVQIDGRVLDFEIKGDPYHVMLDSSLLSHSLTNLIGNAFKYSEGKENPKFIIYFRLTEFSLSITDYGLGIAKEDQSSLFQPFFRANNALEYKGTGLGLSIAKEYVEINKGNITVESILGKVSCFEITFQNNLILND